MRNPNRRHREKHMTKAVYKTCGADTVFIQRNSKRISFYEPYCKKFLVSKKYWFEAYKHFVKIKIFVPQQYKELKIELFQAKE